MMMSIKVPFTLFFVTTEYKTLIFITKMCVVYSLLCAKRQRTASQIDFLSKQFSCGACAAIVCNSVVASVYVLQYKKRTEQNILLFLLLSFETIHVILFDIFLLHIFSFFFSSRLETRWLLNGRLKQKLPQFIFHLSMTFISIILKCMETGCHRGTNNFS